ncbi:hypothetical protein H310_14836 [Aphanomyces invadans]|uniref:SH3 domain-containing protein n=1 Tax=Aphanomyces invadans TaxID=157072 RepID=A0A024TAL9_9STRA|nr:hypothetical protein H310_14836 [Aphanomyces invadans]ETV90362.1 hypothetical protein H310_14836 [Aphanomyces invadans]|eukprot:XP_008880996.1 hypothetical protein H310_14836 [Aphanomyces invadans]
MNEDTNDQLASFITTLVQKELDVLFKSRDENIERLNQQVTALIKDVERITMELESRSAWNRSLTKYEAQLKLAAQDTSPSKKKFAQKSCKRLPAIDPADDDTTNVRNEDGKLVFDKKLPRVANIDKSNQSFLNALTLQSQKQKIYEQAFVRYPECRSTVFAPSSWDPRNISVQQLELPNMQLKLTRVHGYHSTSNSNVFYLASGELAWFTAKVVVMYSKSRQLQRFYMGHSKEVTAMAMHPNAQIVASGQCGKDSALILVWDSKRVNAEPTHALAKLEGQSVNIRSLSFSHDGKLIASLGGDLYNTICVHDWQDQTLLVKARGHSSKVWTVAFNPYQAYGMPDKTKAQQRVPKRQKWEARPRPGQALRDEDACYTLVSCGVQHIKFWTLTQVDYSPPTTVAKEESAFYGSCFGGPNRARQPLPHEKVWKLEGNPPLMKSEAQDFTCLAFTDDNVPLQVYDEATDCIVESPTQSETTLGRIVAGTAKGDLYVFWQPRRSPSPQQPDLPQKWWELPAASWQLSDDVCLEHVHFESTAKLVEIIPHDVSTGNRFKISRHAQMELQDLQQRLALKPDAKPLLDRLASLEYKGPLAHVNGPCSQIACDVRSGNIATAGGDGKVHIWTLHLLDPMRVCGTRTLGQYTPMHGAASDGRHKMQLERSIQIPSKARLTSLHWSGDGAVVAGLSNHSIWEVDVATGEWSVVVEGCEGSVLGGVLLEDQNELVTVSSDHFIRCWDMGSLLCVKKWPLKSTGTYIEAHPSRGDLAVGCAGGEVVVLSYPELSEKKALRVLSNESVSVLKFSPDGKYLAVGAKDNCMHVYDATESYKKVAKCEGHATFVSHIDWSIDGYLLQTNSADGEILYWQVHGASVRQITDGMLMRDILWDRWSCVFGWPVQGIWADHSACNDVSAVCLVDVVPTYNHRPADVHNVLVADRSHLRAFRWPCMKSAQSYNYDGHAANITCILTWKQHYVVTLGGADGTIMEWMAVANEHREVDSMQEGRGWNGEVDAMEQQYTSRPMDNDGIPVDQPSSPTRPPSDNIQRPRTPRHTFIKEGANDVTHQSEESVPDTERNTDDVEVRVPRDEIPAKEEAIREGSTTDGIECGRAKFSFQGEHPDELNLKEGEVIRILEKREGDWWFGETCDGTSGIFPREYVQMD